MFLVKHYDRIFQIVEVPRFTPFLFFVKQMDPVIFMPCHGMEIVWKRSCVIRQNTVYWQGKYRHSYDMSVRKMFFMKNNTSIGRIGEEIACIYLGMRLFHIQGRNFRRPWGEIDIVATDPKGVLAFIEVKTIARSTSDDFLSPEDNLTGRKIQKMKRMAEFYANSHPEEWKKRTGWRIDALTISIPESKIASLMPAFEELTDLINYCEIKYFENVE